MARDMAVALYEGVISALVPVASSRTAEAIKLTENIFRSVNVALVNELKVIFDAMDIDVWDVIDGASTKPFGYMPFYPGPGLGGHCIPIDPFYLSYKAREFDLTARFIELAGEINTFMPQYVVSRTAQALSKHEKQALNGAKILLVGMAYKKNVDDMRESPSLVLTELLEAEGAEVSYLTLTCQLFRPVANIVSWQAGAALSLMKRNWRHLIARLSAPTMMMSTINFWPTTRLSLSIREMP